MALMAVNSFSTLRSILANRSSKFCTVCSNAWRERERERERENTHRHGHRGGRTLREERDIERWKSIAVITNIFLIL